MLFRDRTHAGQMLAGHLRVYCNRADVVVLALPRGGVPVAFEVARALRAPLDVLLARKLGLPGHPESFLGAVAADVIVLNQAVVDDYDLDAADVDAIAKRELRELALRARDFHVRPPLELRGRSVIVVDDGLATGSTMRAAVAALKKRSPARVVVAVPVAAASTCEQLRVEADDVVCLRTPAPFRAVGQWYASFAPVSDDDVRALLRQAIDLEEHPPA